MMNKIITAAAALCIAAACFAGCSDKKSEADDSSIIEVMVPLEMPDINISIPEDFEETSTESNETVYVRDDASIIVNSDVFTEAYDTPEEYVEYAIETYKTYSDEFEIISREKINAADNEGELLEFTYSLNTDNGVFSKYCMVAYFSDGEKMYLVTCKADVDTYMGYREDFLCVIASVMLK